MNHADQVFREEEERKQHSTVNIKPLRDPPKDAEHLVLFIHGALGGDEKRIATFDRFAATHLEGVETAAIRYSSGLLRTRSPYKVAADLQVELIHYLWVRSEEGRRFKKVTIVAYSAGALLTRKVLTWLDGQDEDHPEPERGRRMRLVAEEIEWPSVPVRLALLAGMNRGWSAEGGPASFRSGQRLGRILRALSPSTAGYVGRFLMELERGSRFVANLRIQWLRTRSSPSRHVELVQLLGDEDPLVRVDDHLDVASEGFVLLTVPQKDHRTIWDLAEVQSDNLLAACVTEKLTDLKLRLEYRQSAQPRSTTDREAGIVFIMHGIRDNGDWPRELARMINFDDRTTRDKGSDFHCVTASYGHFPMLGFVSRARRTRNVRWFMDQYANALSQRAHMLEPEDKNRKSHNADMRGELPVHFVGHSNGTYLLAEGLRTYESLRVNRAVFMGSVVPRDYPWDRVNNQRGVNGGDRLRELRNDRGATDWVVGCFPSFYQLARGLSYRAIGWPQTNDLGNGGLRGFDRAAPKHHENYYFPGGHNSMITRDNLRSIARYVTTGTAPETPSQLVRKPGGLVSLASRLCWLIWIALLGFLLGGAVCAGQWASGFVPILNPVAWGLPDWGTAGWVAFSGWLAFWFLVTETA